jgi:hypothetical protein
VQIAVLLLLAVLTVFFGFYWGNQAFGIALGFGLYAAMVIVNSELYGHVGVKYFHIHNVIDVLAYSAASLIWLAYAVKERKEDPPDLPKDRDAGHKALLSGTFK